MKIPNEKIENFTQSPKEEGRPVMKCVWLDVAGRRMLATDGHMAMRVAVEVDECEVSGLVPFEVFELGRKELQVITKIQGKESIPHPWLKIQCDEATVLIENLLTNTKHLVNRPQLGMNESFPCVDAVFKQLTVQPTITLCKDLVVRALKSVDPISLGISMFVKSPEDAVIMATPEGKGLVALMPMRGGIELDEVNMRAVPALSAETESSVGEATDVNTK
jgi:hypothetical protein